MKGTVARYTLTGGRVRWRIIYDRGPDPATGKRRQTTKGGFTRERDAHAALRKILGAVEDGTHTDFTRQTVGEYLAGEWLPSRKPTTTGGRGYRGQVSIGTWDAYRQVIDAYLVPGIGQIRLQQLSAADLDRLYDDLEESGGRAGTGLSRKTLSNIHGVLHKALADAVKRRKVPRNVAAAVEAPTARSHATDRVAAAGEVDPDSVWDLDQLRRFLAEVADDRMYALWLLYATTGARRGEALGLTWPDVDLDGATVRIGATLGAVDGKATWKPTPKSKAGLRTMSLDPATVDGLRAHRTRQNEERLYAGPAWRARQVDWRGNARSDLVFTWPDGRMIHPDRITRWFTQHTQRAGLPRIRLHDVRHSYATAALANATGWHDVKVISQRLGHASIGITLDTYSHVLPAADEHVALSLGRLIAGDTTS